jgi:signal transduction histidine kinase
MRSLRARLFLAILGAVLLAVGASLALGIVLTREAVQETLRGHAAERLHFAPPPGLPPPPPPVDVLGGDFRRYLAGLLIAGGAGALLAAALAALLARRLTRPLHRLSGAAGELAAGRHPDPVPRGGPREIDEMAASFNAMAEQLALARDAERGVLLSVSHDLRTPLTSIRGYVEGIEDGTVEPREAAAVVGREAGRLDRLVGDLLALARLRQGVLEVRREPVDLGAVAREAEERLRPAAAEGGVEVSVLGGPAPAVADHGRSLQIVSNLLENAIRVSPRGGAVTIAVAPGEVAVSDQGPGIPAEEISRAFERFHLRAAAGRGSPAGAGLGLAIVRELSEAMGGSAAVENLPARGARFTVRLPVRAELP